MAPIDGLPRGPFEQTHLELGMLRNKNSRAPDRWDTLHNETVTDFLKHGL